MRSRDVASCMSIVSKGGSDAADALEAAARGENLSALLRRFEPQIRPEVFRPTEGDLRWHFMRQAN